MLTLTATELPRFMICNGFISMPDNLAFNIDDTLRNEGNAIAWMFEQVHKHNRSTDEMVDRKAFNGVFITEQMVEDATTYLNDIAGKGVVECDTSYGDGQRYQVNGRSDHIYYHDLNYTLFISDFKYGWSIVEPEKNWTLISHAIGWILANPNLPVKTVVLRIYQPRPHHPLGKVREHPYTIEAIGALQAELQYTMLNPKNLLNTSEFCRDCPKLASCPAAQKAGMNSIDVSETAYVSEIDDNSLGFILDQCDRAIKVLEQNKKAYGELALHRIKAGKIIPGYGTEKDLTNKQWKEGITPETAMMLVGVDLTKKQLITPAQALKKGVSEAAIDSLCERREKGVKLAKIDPSTQVKKMFGNMK